MSNLAPLLERNAEFARTGAYAGLTPIPAHQVIVVTCIDGRVDPAHILGVDLGDALVLRNAGGRVNEDVVNEIAFVATLTETMFGDDAPPFEVAVVHHTACGSGFLADEGFRRRYAERIGADERELASRAVTDPEATVRGDAEELAKSPRLPSRASVSGHVYDVDTGLVKTIVPAQPVG
ncbi:MAG: carbonic anhydrase [Ilumatobacteraceae bacterium]